MQYYNSVCCVWVWNSVTDMSGKAESEGAGESIGEKYICAEEGRWRQLEEAAQWGASSFVRLNKYSVDEIMENKMDEICGTHGEEEKVIRDFGGDTWT